MSFHSSPKKWIRSTDLISHRFFCVSFLSHVINIISLMASFFKALRQLSREKHSTEKFLMWWSHISTNITSPRRLWNSRMKFKCTQIIVSHITQEKSQLQWLPFNDCTRRLLAVWWFKSNKKFQAGRGRPAFKRDHLLGSLARGSNLPILQHTGNTGDEGTTQKGDNQCELTAWSPGLKSLNWPPDFHQDNQGVFGKQHNE